MANQVDDRREEPDSERSRAEMSGAEQRRAPRVTLVIRMAKLIADGHEYFCIIRDVSATGVKVRIFHPLPRHETLLLELGNGDRYPVEQVWRTSDHMGFRFNDEVDVQSVIHETHGPFPRRQLRLGIALDARVYSGCESCTVALHDISQQGACIECEKRLLINELVRIETNGLPTVYAKVRWRRPPRYGLVFEQTFRLDELARMLAPMQMSEAPEQASR